MIREKLIYIRNKSFRIFYKSILKKIFFRIDPELVHDSITYIGRIVGANFITRKATSILFSSSLNKKLEQTISGIKFPNPLGLAAGFDKDAHLINIIPSIGFGFEEVGAVTGEACEGNPKPRLWRLPKSNGLVVYYGLKNDGEKKISKRIEGKNYHPIPLGVNIAKTNSRKTAFDVTEGISDYVKTFNAFLNIADYFTINISCPNTFGGQQFTNPDLLDKLLTEIDKIPTKKPVFLKISPDLSIKEIDRILKVSHNHHVNGFICTNLTENRDNNPKIIDPEIKHIKKGGISGKVVNDLSNKLIRYVYAKTKGKYIIIGCGGVFTAEDAYKKIKLGASLVQLITGMIFEGPQLISEINQDLSYLLMRDGFDNISCAIGVDN